MILIKIPLKAYPACPRRPSLTQPKRWAFPSMSSVGLSWRQPRKRGAEARPTNAGFQQYRMKGALHALRPSRHLERSTKKREVRVGCSGRSDLGPSLLVAG
jgi:hypothetical protein